MKDRVLFFCLLFFVNVWRLCNSQNSEIIAQRLAWQRQIDRVKQNERILQEYIAKQARTDGGKKTIDVQGKTFDIFPANPLKDEEQAVKNHSDQSVERSLDLVEASPKESYLAEAEKLIKKYSKLIEYPSYADTNTKNGRDYLKEAEQFLKRYSSDGFLSKSSFPSSKKIKSQTAKQATKNVDIPSLSPKAAPKKIKTPTVKQTTKKNVDIVDVPSPSPTSIKSKKDVPDILAQNIDTKEGLKAIVTELLKRRIEKLKVQTEK